MVLAAILWTPPVIDQIVHTPGNLSVLSDYFRNPPESPVGLRRAIDVFFVHLNPWHLVEHLVTADRTKVESGSLVPGALFLALWAASAVAAWRIRHRALLRLDLVLGVALVLALVSMSRIFGLVWYYLVLWAWGICALMVLAVVWTAVVLVGKRLARPTAARVAAVGTAVLVGVAMLFSALFTYDATSADVPAPRLSHTLGVLVRPTAAALDRRSAPGGGRQGLYLVTLRDPVDIGAMGYGLVNELDRRGFDVGVLDIYGPGATRYRVIDPAQATGVVHLAIGPDDIDVWRAKPGAREVARHRSPHAEGTGRVPAAPHAGHRRAGCGRSHRPRAHRRRQPLRAEPESPGARTGAPEAHSDDEPGATHVRVHRPTRGRGLT